MENKYSNVPISTHPWISIIIEQEKRWVKLMKKLENLDIDTYEFQQLELDVAEEIAVALAMNPAQREKWCDLYYNRLNTPF